MSENTGQNEFEDLDIPVEERNNIWNLFGLLKKTAKEQGLEIELEVVGGVKSKKWPRKDIDVTVTTNTNRPKGKNKLDETTAEYNEIVQLVESATKGSFFKIKKKILPYANKEFGDLNILDHKGSVEIEPQTGTPIELINKGKN